MKTVLDLGCGKKKHPNSVGMDFNKDTDADVVHDLNKYPYPFPKNSFDVIYCSHILEHLDNLVKTMEEMHRIARPNARIIIRVPHASQCGVWANPTHRRVFATKTFDYFEKGSQEKYSDKYFVVVKKRLHYLYDEQSHSEWEVALGRFLDRLANLNLYFCERVWCYWVGGFSEVYFELKVVK